MNIFGVEVSERYLEFCLKLACFLVISPIRIGSRVLPYIDFLWLLFLFSLEATLSADWFFWGISDLEGISVFALLCYFRTFTLRLSPLLLGRGFPWILQFEVRGNRWCGYVHNKFEWASLLSSTSATRCCRCAKIPTGVVLFN
jgi:hypothetical protein